MKKLKKIAVLKIFITTQVVFSIETLVTLKMTEDPPPPIAQV